MTARSVAEAKKDGDFNTGARRGRRLNGLMLAIHRS
jgi:hypothetical protein